MKNKIRYGNSEKCENCKFSFTKENTLFCAKTINQIQPNNNGCEKFVKRNIV